MPSSSTQSTRRGFPSPRGWGLVSHVAMRTDFPLGVNLTALLSRLKRTCLIFRSSASTTKSEPVPGVHVQPDALFVGALPDHGHGGNEQIPWDEGVRFQLHPSGLDLGQVQDVVDEVQQVPRAGEDVRDVLALFGREGPEELVLEDLREPDDGGHGGAQFVAHVGEELGLGPVGALGLKPGILQLLGALLDEERQLALAPGKDPDAPLVSPTTSPIVARRARTTNQAVW